MLGLVPLANRAAMDEVVDEVVCVRVIERCAQPMQRLLGTLMTGVMGFKEKLWPEGGSIRRKKMCPWYSSSSSTRAPRHQGLAGFQLVAQGQGQGITL
jgi:hypothetical protein